MIKVRTGDADDFLKLNSEIKLDSDLVQIVKQTQHIFHVYIDEELKEPKEYREAFNIIRNASPYDLINVVLNTMGGDLATALQFYNYLIDTQAQTIAEIHSAYSGGSIIALACDNIYITAYGSMMIHSMSSGLMGKIHEMERYSSFIQRFSENIVREIYDTFLTKSEIDEVIRGKDFWLDEKEIKSRLVKYIPIRKRLQQKHTKKKIIKDNNGK